MEHTRLCESDYRFLSVIWDHEPLSSTELVRCCAEELGWKKSTTYTMLKKLCGKGMVENEQTIVRALVSREDVQAKESALFVEQTFSGSLPGFLLSFYGGKKLSAGEADELKRLIDELKED